MATTHINSHKPKGDLSRFVDQGIARRLQLDGASDYLKKYIQTTIETKANGMFLWANLMLDILKWQTPESAMRNSLHAAPEGIDDIITEMLKVYSSMFKGPEAEEFNTILAWLSRATRPLTLYEIDAALRRLSPDASRVLSLEVKLKTTYAPLIDMIRVDGLSTAFLHARHSSMPSATTPETTTIAFAHASIAEYFQKGLGKFSKRKTAAAVGVTRYEAEALLLRTCLEVFVTPGDGAWLESSKALQPYAKHSWYHHIQRMTELHGALQEVEVANTLGQGDSARNVDIVSLLHDFLNEEIAIHRWSCVMPWNFYDDAKIRVLAYFVALFKARCPDELPSSIASWLAMCEKLPQTMLLPVARLTAKEGFQGEWLALPSLLVVAQIKALAENDDTLDTLPERLPLTTIMGAAEWADLEENASWNRKLGICLRNSGYTAQALDYFKRALELDHNLVEARSGLATSYREMGYFSKVIDLELENAKILCRYIADAEVPPKEKTPAHAALHKLCMSYEVVAFTYQCMEDRPMASNYYCKALATGCRIG
jgi:tetratricopeptide (TPR) repeat protein